MEDEYLEELDFDDEKRIIIDFEKEKPEPRFRWEYAHESITEIGSVFRDNWPDR